MVTAQGQVVAYTASALSVPDWSPSRARVVPKIRPIAIVPRPAVQDLSWKRADDSDEASPTGFERKNSAEGLPLFWVGSG